MITDNIIDLISLIDGFLLDYGSQFTDFISRLQDFFNDILPTYVPVFSQYLGYLYYFIPPGYLIPMVIIGALLIFLRIVFAVVNLIWP